MISPTNREVDIRLDNNDFSEDEYIGMCRRKVRNMMMISPTNREVDIRLDNNDFSEDEYIGMCRREVMDKFMRDRAEELGTNVINGLVTEIDVGTDPDKQ